MSKFLVTGGAGFIGSEICQQLIALGHEVVALDNLSSGHLENLDSVIDNPRFKFVLGDITDYETCQKACRQRDYVIHQAALVSVPLSIEKPQLNNEINIKGFVNILEASRINQVKKVVYASSSAVYGDNTDLIKLETQTGNVLSPYALSKMADECYAKLYTNLYQLPTVGLRYFNVYGPKQDPSSVYSGVISIFFKKALSAQDLLIYGDGSITRDFINVSDVAHANVLACLTCQNDGEVYNIGTGRAVSIKELAQLVLRITQAKVQIKYATGRTGDILYSCANVQKAKNELRFLATISLEDGLSQMAACLKP
ncbi:MAG TPA: SDR family NAD(P)-dependent oxidoreductase [Bacilli bacterium]|nr:MAG: UDP-glucose 4-epimerase [Tenericutes bacterium ADurb.BinA124]HNZ50167.1 SDR family NAD(P)-dependent oxidoreductase [Bacilli bacterium]HOH17869.1 SDR family NAD(P)-dependent oxidoreductase [Bacilli bacterium]HPN60723.1 SDR family NAD(P)-dependent oxidoreductase [Bacilli bacterium]HPX84804.1 SDR family NAD(P)-dependent oxidoreductase [Bacilli bacterium]